MAENGATRGCQRGAAKSALRTLSLSLFLFLSFSFSLSFSPHVRESAVREGRASENFYDTLEAFMSRVNLANSASFAPRRILVARGLSSFLGSLAARMHCRGDAIKPARNDAVPKSLLPLRREEEKGMGRREVRRGQTWRKIVTIITVIIPVITR